MDKIIRQENAISPKNKCVQFMFCYQQHDINGMLGCCSPDATIFFTPLGEGGKGGVDSFGKAMWEGLIDSFPDLDNTVDAVVAEGDHVRCQVLIRGTQARDFAGITSKGKHFDSDHIFIFKLDDHDLITDISVTWDHADLVRQLS